MRMVTRVEMGPNHRWQRWARDGNRQVHLGVIAWSVVPMASHADCRTYLDLIRSISLSTTKYGASSFSLWTRCMHLERTMEGYKTYLCSSVLSLLSNVGYLCTCHLYAGVRSAVLHVTSNGSSNVTPSFPAGIACAKLSLHVEITISFQNIIDY